MSSYFQKNEKEDFKKTLSKLFKSSLWVIGKSVRKRQLQHSHDSNFSQVWKSLSHFQYFLAHFHSQLSLLQITFTNFYKLKDSSFIWKWIITIRCWKLEKLDKLVSIDVSILQSTLSFSFFTSMHVSKSTKLITKALLYFSSRKSRCYTPFLCQSLFNSLKDSSFLYFLLSIVQDNQIMLRFELNSSF